MVKYLVKLLCMFWYCSKKFDHILGILLVCILIFMALFRDIFSHFCLFCHIFDIVLGLYCLYALERNIGFEVCMTIFLFILICIPFGYL